MKIGCALPLLLRLTSEGQLHYIPGTFTLGVFSKPVAAVSLLWLLGVSGLIMLPRTFPLTKNNFNYSSIALVSMLFLFGLSWFRARTDFTGGPKIDSRASHHTAPSVNIGGDGGGGGVGDNHRNINSKHGKGTSRNRVISNADSYVSVQHRELNPQRNTNRPMELVSLETLHRLRAKAARQRTPPPQLPPPFGSPAGAAVERQGKPMSAFNTQKGVSSPQPAGRAKKQGKRVLEKESQHLYHREGNKPPPLDMAGVMSGKKGENAMTGLSTGESARSVATSSILGIPLSESPEMMQLELPDVHPADLSAADSVMEMNAFEQEHAESDGRTLLHQFDSASAPLAPLSQPSSHERKDDHDHDHSVMASHSSPSTSCPNLTNTNGSTPISSSPGIPLSIAKESLMLTQPFPALPAESYSSKSNGSSSNDSHSPQLSFPQSLHVTPVIPSIEIAPATTISSQESRSLGTDSSSSIGNSPLISHGKHEFNETPSPFIKHQHQQYNVTSPATAAALEPPTDVTLERNYKQTRDPRPDAFASQSIMATGSSQQGCYARNIAHDSSPPELCDCGAHRAPNAAPTNHHPTSSDDQGGQISKEGEADTSSDEYHYTVDIGRRSTRARAALESIQQIKLPKSGSSTNPRPAPPPTTLFQSRIPRPIKSPPPPPFPSLPSSNMLPSTQSFGDLAESTLGGVVGFRSVKGRIPTPYPSSLADQDESSVPETHPRSSVSIDKWEIQEHDLLLSTPATQPQHASSNERKAKSTLHLPTIHQRSKRIQVDQEDNTTVSTLTLEQATDDLQIKERPSPLPHLQMSHSLLSPTSAASKLPAYPTHPTSKLALGENSHGDSTWVSKEAQKHNEGGQSERQVKGQYSSQLPAVPPTASARKKQDKNKKRPLPINTSLAMSPPPHIGFALDVEDYKRIATRKLDRRHHPLNDPLSAKGALSSDTRPFQGRTSTAQDPSSQHQLQSLQDSAREGRSRSQQHLEYVQRIHSRPLPSPPPHEHHHYFGTIRASEARDTDRHNRRHHVYHQEGDADADADADDDGDDDDDDDDDNDKEDDDDDDDDSVNASHACAQFQALESERDMYRQKRRTVADWAREQSRIQEKRERRRARARAARAAAAFAAVRQRLESQSAPSMDHLAFRSQSPPPVVAAAAVAAIGRHHRTTKRATEEEAVAQSVVAVVEETASLDSSSSSLFRTSSLSSGSEGKGGAMWALSSHHHYPHRHEPYQLHHHRQRRHRHHTQSTRQQQWQLLPKSLHHPPSGGKHERQQHAEEAREGKHSQREISSPTSDTHPTTIILTGTLNAPNTIQANSGPDNVHVGRRSSNPSQEKKEREERDDERSRRGIQDEVYKDGSYDSDPSKNTAYHAGEFDPSGSHAMRRSYQPSVDTESLGAGVGRA
ncbi:hypothetical protein BGW42_007783 [Actinomortierella wolfii]|nr:hypothetical protein BGW42_007783 [Actinomortierella wolfii]